MVSVQGKTEKLDVTIHWAGGFASHNEIQRPVGRYQQLGDYQRLMQRVLAGRDEGQSSREIAEQLRREGFRSPRARMAWTSAMVRQLLSRRGLTGNCSHSMADLLQADEWWLSDLALTISFIIRTSPMALSFMPLKNVSHILIESSVAKRRRGKAWGFNPRNFVHYSNLRAPAGRRRCGWFPPAPLRGYQRLWGIEFLGLKPQALRLRRYAA